MQMNTPSFHQHFRQLAGMSPLRYRKWLSLNEARRLMLNEHYDVTTAAYAVGLLKYKFWRIMKLKHVGMIVVSVLAMSSAAVSAAEGDESVTTTVNGGVIHFKGEVVNAACAIDSESMNQTVELGQVRSSRLAKAGDLSSAVGFNIKLNDCDTNVSSNAAVAFLGTTVTSNDDTLALQSSAAGSAQNVGIQILDRTGEVLILDGATFSAKTDLIDGTNILPFQARYIALGQSVAGTANADATFKVQYL
ncbi:TPA: type 1 fimbrial major subunit FimA [Escherichia coli O146:H28]|nr:type 1 fimbrial major subunit FimA [Escherichia coli O146:H28]